MVNDLHDLLEQNVASPPHDRLDVGAVLTAGRRRVRRRRVSVVGGVALATVGLVAAGSLVPWNRPPDFAAAGVPRPDAPTLRLDQADPAVKGRDYRVLASHTNENLDRDNGQYFDGVTEDGLILFRDGPRREQLFPRFALLDPATGEKDWLPSLDVGQQEPWPVELAEDRLVLLGFEGWGERVDYVAHVFDRQLRRWDTVRWPGLPGVENPSGAVLGPDDRLYVPVLATQGGPPEGGWPMGPDGEADDADAEGETHRLWSASLTDVADVRDEGLTVGSVAFTDDAMVWTDATDGDAGRVHVRDIATGKETAFDPRAGERCNLLGFGAVDDRVVMSQYCGTYADGVRDDRVQVVDTDGDQVVTVQGSGIEGGVASTGGDGIVKVTSHEPGATGTYVYDLASDRFLRVSEDVSSWGSGGPAPEDRFLFNVPANRGRGMTVQLGELLR